MSVWLARIVLVLAACMAGVVCAQERILAYDSTVDIRADGEPIVPCKVAFRCLLRKNTDTMPPIITFDRP